MPLIIHEGQEFNLSHEEQDQLNQFQMITTFPDADLPLIIRLLQNHGWKLERAMSSYYDNDWKASLEAENSQPAIPERPSTPNVNVSIGEQNQDLSPFLISDMNLVPSLPIVKPIPANYLETYSIVGLNKRKNESWKIMQESSPLLVILMFIPKVLGKLGIGIISLLWGIITFGFRSNVGNENMVSKVPSLPSGNNMRMEEILPQIADENAMGPLLDILCTKMTFNDALKECQEEFKFLLVILIGNISLLESDERDKNSQLFLSKIISEQNVLSLLKSHAQDLVIYAGCVEELEPWLVAKQLKVRYTPECLLVGNVLNSSGSINGVTRLSVLSRLRLTSAKRFYKSLKLSIERYNAELLVSRNEQHELRMAREIRSKQDAAYEESLRQQKVKDEMRRKENEEIVAKQNNELELERKRKWKETAKHLFWLRACVNLLDEKMPISGTKEDTATLQARTSQGLRMILNFKSNTTLYTIYVTLGCFLYLSETKLDSEQWKSKIRNKIKELSKDMSVQCFTSQDIIPEFSDMQEMKKLIEQELSNVPEVFTGQTYVDFDFELVSPFPRHEIPANSTVTIKDVNQLWPKGSVLIEDVVTEDSGGDSGSEEDDA
ncbi:hypothetical protein HG535_0D05090 [Zygotorulaspora mrakii]|uniref:UBX domain-containing protein n=1 Tax=Zygotorulaspora mrakii TaxID=42260 RepID=A0A7H9B2G0_ZYGMR|nr:uncharacterized protein HG535_0D05090 [Zygotorulaspora mrakii]QLG72800.1 hypothetical protein HG535_0D05090 [Zygotorulaspora mrakii]